jgi:GNAT superfamily N-acetyltransferase
MMGWTREGMQAMAFGLPNVSFIGYPVAVPCAGHAGLGLRQATPADSAALVEHFHALTADDRRMRFCATLNDEALRQHVDGLWRHDALVLAAHDGPLWSGPQHRAGPVRALAELVVTGEEAELGISVDATMRRRGIGTYLVQTAARLLAPRGVKLIRATTLPDNASFIALAQACGAKVAGGPDGVEAAFDVAALNRAYLRRRAAQVISLAS